VPAEELQQANSLLGLPASFFSVAGPAVGGVLIAVFGPGWLFAADAASFLVSLACLALLRVPPRPVPAARSFLADLAEGWHELAIRPWYWVNLLAHACGNFAVPALFVLGPVIAARSLGGAPAWGALSASWGTGAVAGGIVGLRVKPRRPLVATDLLMAGIGLPLLALAFSRSVALIAAAEAVFGFTMIVGNSVWFTAMQVLIPDNVRARVGAYDWFASLVIMPVGWLVMGPLSSSIGFTATLVAAAALGAIPCVLVALVPRVRGVHRTPAGELVVDVSAPSPPTMQQQGAATASAETEPSKPRKSGWCWLFPVVSRPRAESVLTLAQSRDSNAFARESGNGAWPSSAEQGFGAYEAVRLSLSAGPLTNGKSLVTDSC
jgi:hypothetical protein